MNKFRETIYFNRCKEDNWDLQDRGRELGFANPEHLAYVGYEISLEVEISEDNRHKVLSFDGVDVRDKDIYI